MIKYEEALKIVLEKAVFKGQEEVLLENACGRVLAEDIEADIDMPLFNKSRMDGFACRREDLMQELEVIDTVYAGEVSDEIVTTGTCIRIMTGAPVPAGADCVIMVEETKTLKDDTIVFTGVKTDDNISFKGEDFKIGDILLSKGKILKPHHIAILATAGRAKVKVALRPRVALLVTGNELSSFSEKPKDGHIRDSNTPQLKAQIEEMGADLTFCSHIGDKLESTISAIAKAKDVSDLILLSGGVSMGEYDFVPKAIEALGGLILIEKVAVKPGKPSKFAAFEKSCCLGLPGNPVSSFVQFEILAKPFLYKLMGCDYKPLEASFILAEDFRRKENKRKEWYPVKIINHKMIKPLKQQSSGDIASLAEADGLMIIEQGISEIAKGSEINVRLLRS
ncbi:MAG: gephyrin-like molybdotransferase Glp [Alphaproteobacteria bacterium]